MKGPCGIVRCSKNLGLETANRSISSDGVKLSESPDERELDAFVDVVIARITRVGSCVLRLVESHPDGMTLEEVGAVLGVTRERIRQIEKRAKPPLVRRVRHLRVAV